MRISILILTILTSTSHALPKALETCREETFSCKTDAPIGDARACCIGRLACVPSYPDSSNSTMGTCQYL